jgi:hypothetical protein
MCFFAQIAESEFHFRSFCSYPLKVFIKELDVSHELNRTTEVLIRNFISQPFMSESVSITLNCKVPLQVIMLGKDQR